MRVLSVVLAACAVTSCMAGPSPQQVAAAAAQQEAELAPLLAGKVPGRPLTCMPYRVGNDMRIIGPNLITFRDGANRVFVNRMRGSCPNLNSHYTLVTQQFGGASGPCSGEIAQLIDPGTGAGFGSCVWGDFEPFVRP